MKNKTKKAPAKLSKSQNVNNAWKTRKANKIKQAEEFISLISENLDLKKEVEILNQSIKSCENALLNKNKKAFEIFNKRCDVANKIEELKCELKHIDNDIFEMKATLNSELNILS